MVWRLAVLILGLLVLSYGQVADTNDLFPFGSLSQYGTPRDPNGTVVAFHVEADTDAGTRVRVPLNARGVGVGRAEVEGQVNRIRHDPALLQSLADAHAQLRPAQPRYTTVYLVRSERQLKDGRQVGHAKVTDDVVWSVR